jgi:addiction module HigA family antidote
MTPGERLQKLLDARGWTQEEASMELDVSRFSVNQLVNGRRNVTAEMAVRLETVFDEGPSARRWLGLQAAVDLAEARRRLRAFVGHYDRTSGRRNTHREQEAS